VTAPQRGGAFIHAQGGADVEVLSLSELMRFLSRTYQELDVVLDPNTKRIWCYQRPKGLGLIIRHEKKEFKVNSFDMNTEGCGLREARQ
jgi:hypothetical protein